VAAYVAVDTGTNVPMAFSAYFMLTFYNDVFRLPAIAGAITLFIYRVVAACDDLSVGFFISRRIYKRGKYRPYYLWLCVPFAVLTVLSYYTPGLRDAGKLAYTFVVLLACELTYTFINSATNSLLPHIAAEQDKRVRINTMKVICSVTAFVLVSVTARGMLDAFGQGDERRGYFMTACVFAALSLAPHLFAYFNIKEKPYIESVQRKRPIKELLGKILGNKGILLVVAVYFCFQLGNGFRDYTIMYYAIYHLGAPQAISVVIWAGVLPTLPTNMMIPWLLKRGRIETWMMVGLVGMAVTGALFVPCGTSLALFLVVRVCHGAFSALPGNLIFPTVALFVDKELRENRENVSELYYTTLSFGYKMGSAFSIGLCMVIMKWTGYQAASAVQTAGAVMGIEALFIGGAFAVLAVGALMMAFLIKWMNGNFIGKDVGGKYAGAQ
jgi:Na+/melibiose symporter-like transporter